VQISSITFWSGSTAAVTPTNQWFALVRQSDRAVLRATTDDTTAAWAANTAKTLSLSSAYTPGSDTLAYVGVMVAATTPPTFCGKGLALQALAHLTPSLSTLSTSGLTTPSADGTTLAAGSGNTSLPYCYLS
jgi:hypothetical protein